MYKVKPNPIIEKMAKVFKKKRVRAFALYVRSRCTNICIYTKVGAPACLLMFWAQFLIQKLYELPKFE